MRSNCLVWSCSLAKSNEKNDHLLKDIALRSHVRVSLPNQSCFWKKSVSLHFYLKSCVISTIKLNRYFNYSYSKSDHKLPFTYIFIWILERINPYIYYLYLFLVKALILLKYSQQTTINTSNKLSLYTLFIPPNYEGFFKQKVT